MIDRRSGHGQEYPFGHIGGAGDLQEMAPAQETHRKNLLGKRKAPPGKLRIGEKAKILGTLSGGLQAGFLFLLFPLLCKIPHDVDVAPMEASVSLSTTVSRRYY